MLATLTSNAARPGSINEDYVGVSNDSALLLDGAGSAGTESGCVHSVTWYVRSLGVALLSAITLRTDDSLTDLLAGAIQLVSASHADTCDLSNPGTPASTVVMLRHREGVLDYLVLADSVLVLQRQDGTHGVVVDNREAEIGRKFRQHMDSLAGGTPEHDMALRDYVATMQRLRNDDDGYWIASSEPAAASHALTGTVPLGTISSAALLSDGASRLVDRFHLTNWSDALDLLRQQGPQELIRRVRKAEWSDPEGRHWPRGKVHDDASVIYCRGFTAND